jgi:ligand-binding SRPBCC domain-containing protein
VWNFLREAISEVDVQALKPVWQVVFDENSEDAA